MRKNSKNVLVQAKFLSAFFQARPLVSCVIRCSPPSWIISSMLKSATRTQKKNLSELVVKLKRKGDTLSSTRSSNGSHTRLTPSSIDVPHRSMAEPSVLSLNDSLEHGQSVYIYPPLQAGGSRPRIQSAPEESRVLEYAPWRKLVMTKSGRCRGH